MAKRNGMIKCDGCGLVADKLKKLKKLSDGFFCTKCCAKRRKERRDFLLHDVAGVRRRTDMIEEAKERRKKREKAVKEVVCVPKIKGAKERKIGVKISALGLYLTRDEKSVLYWKHRGQGLCSEEANKQVKKNVEFLGVMVEKMKNQRKTEEEISRKFKEEFAKLCAMS